MQNTNTKQRSSRPGKKGRNKFARPSSVETTWADFLENCNASTSEHSRIIDRSADDIYLPKIRENRGTVKELSINDPQTRSALDYRTHMAVGNNPRIKPRPFLSILNWSEAQGEVFEERAKSLWSLIMDSDSNWIDSQGIHNVGSLAKQHTRIFDSEGESFALFRDLPENRRSPLSFTVLNIDPPRIRDPSDKESSGLLRSQNIRDGILKSVKSGGPLGYFIHDHHPNSTERFKRGGDAYTYVDKRNRVTGQDQVIHSYIQITSDLTRGISKLASCLTLSCQKRDYIDSLVEDAIAKAGISWIIKSDTQNLEELMMVLSASQNADEKGMDGFERYMHRSKAWHKAMGTQDRSGQKAVRLLHGEELDALEASLAGGATFEAFDMVVDNVSALCHGLSVEEYRQRWDKTNFFGAKAGKMFVYNMLQDLRVKAPWNFIRKIYCRFMEDMILQGLLELPGHEGRPLEGWLFYMENKDAINRVEIFGSPRDELDKAKTADGYLAESELGVATKEAYCNEVQGRDWREVNTQIVREARHEYALLEQALAPDTPQISLEDLILHKLNGGPAFLARKNLRLTGAVEPDPVSSPTDLPPEGNQ